MDEILIKVIFHSIVILFLIVSMSFAYITYILYKIKVNRGLAATSLLLTVALFALYLYYVYKLIQIGGFFN